MLEHKQEATRALNIEATRNICKLAGVTFSNILNSLISHLGTKYTFELWLFGSI